MPQSETNNHVNLPSDPKLAGRIIDAQTAHANRIAELGMVGGFFGSRENAVVYIAGSIVAIAMIGCGFMAWLDPSIRSDIGKAYATLAASALGFMFGSGGKSKGN